MGTVTSVPAFREATSPTAESDPPPSTVSVPRKRSIRGKSSSTIATRWPFAGRSSSVASTSSPVMSQSVSFNAPSTSKLLTTKPVVILTARSTSTGRRKASTRGLSAKPRRPSTPRPVSTTPASGRSAITRADRTVGSETSGLSSIKPRGGTSNGIPPEVESSPVTGTHRAPDSV